jgi:hypothetical protein
MNERREKHAQRVWRAPALIASANLLGLVSALIGDGLFDAISWIALATGIVAIGWAWKIRHPRVGQVRGSALR